MECAAEEVTNGEEEKPAGPPVDVEVRNGN